MIQKIIKKIGKSKLSALLLMISFSFIMVGCGNVDSSSKAALNQNVNNETEDLHKDEQANNENGLEKKELEQQEKAAAEQKKKEAMEKADREKKEAEAKQVDKEQKEQAGKLGELKVHYINVGQADATLLEATDDNGKKTTMLIDTGDWNRTDALDYLTSVGITEIDIVVGTHPHADHIGQMDKILNTFNVNEVWMSGDMSSSQVFQRALQAVDDIGANYVEPRAGENYQLGNLTIDILSPASVNGNANDGSIAMRITYGSVVFLFTGDAETKAEQAMVSSGRNLKADILHLGHHGSDTSTIPAFFEKVSPKTAIYSAGKENSYGHPSPSVINRVKNADVELYGTDVHGTIVVTTDGKTYDVATNQKGTINGTLEKKKSKAQTKSKPESKTQAKPKAETKPQTESKSKTEPTKKEKPKEQTTSASCIDINSASKEQLQNIVHIGDVRADLIIEARPFSSVDDLTRVKGIAAGRLADIVAEGKACVK